MLAERNKIIFEKFLTGSTTRQLAEEYGVSHQRISQLLGRFMSHDNIFKMAHSRKRKKISDPEKLKTTICSVCGTSFTHYKKIKRVTCSTKCRLNILNNVNTKK